MFDDVLCLQCECSYESRNRILISVSPLLRHADSLSLSLSLSLCSRPNPNEGGRPAISAYWADNTQAQLSAMMATVTSLS